MPTKTSARVRPIDVSEVFFGLEVNDVRRAIEFYSKVFGATTSHSAPQWASIHIASVRIGLLLNAKHRGAQVGLKMGVADLESACAAIERAGGKTVMPSTEAAPNVFIAEVSDTEGNVFTLRKD